MKKWNAIALAVSATLLVACASQQPEPKKEKPKTAVAVIPPLRDVLSKALPITVSEDSADALTQLQSESTRVLLTDTSLSEADMLRLQNAWGRRPVRLLIAVRNTDTANASSGSTAATEKAEDRTAQDKQEKETEAAVYAEDATNVQRVFAYVNLPPNDPKSAEQLQKNLQSWWDDDGLKTIHDAGFVPPSASIIQSNEVALGLRPPRMEGGYR